jgi:hypothetical protein
MDIVQGVGGFLTPYAYENITIDGTAGGKGFTVGNIWSTASMQGRDLGKTRLIIATLEDATIRYTTVIGVPPTAGANGHLVDIGTMLSFANLKAMQDFRAIRETGVSGTLHVTYYR